MNPLISFVLIEYFCLEDIFRCILSIVSTVKNVPYEIIVSSNSVYPHSMQRQIIEKNKQIIWKFNEKNGGFAYGMNSGIELASGEYVIISNPDVKILSLDIEAVSLFFDSNPLVGMVGPQIVDSKGVVQDSCRPFLKLFDIISRFMKRIIKNNDVLLDGQIDYSLVQKIDWIIGAFMIVRRSAITEVGLLDDKYFLYVEDMDWCKRFWDNSYQVWYCPSFQVEYKGDRKSTNSYFVKFKINKYLIYHVKSYLRFVKKYGLSPCRNEIKK